AVERTAGLDLDQALDIHVDGVTGDLRRFRKTASDDSVGAFPRDGARHDPRGGLLAETPRPRAEVAAGDALDGAAIDLGHRLLLSGRRLRWWRSAGLHQRALRVERLPERLPLLGLEERDDRVEGIGDVLGLREVGESVLPGLARRLVLGDGVAAGSTRDAEQPERLVGALERFERTGPRPLVGDAVDRLDDRDPLGERRADQWDEIARALLERDPRALRLLDRELLRLLGELGGRRVRLAGHLLGERPVALADRDARGGLVDLGVGGLGRLDRGVLVGRRQAQERRLVLRPELGDVESLRL